MNIIYNKSISEKEIALFKLMEEYVYSYLKDKSIFYKITVYFNEIEDKNDGLSYVGLCTINPPQPYKAIIKISDYAIRLTSQAYRLNNKKPYDTFEKYRYKLIFHELGHIIAAYNDKRIFRAFTAGYDDIFIKEDEDNVNKMAVEYLKNKKNI